MGNINFIDGATGEKKIEKVYGESFVKWLYQSPIGKAIAPLVSRPFFSKLYGFYQDLPISKKKIAPFIKKFSIAMEDFLPAEKRSTQDPYRNFNEFFTRRLLPGARPFCQEENFPAPCEGRYLCYPQITEDIRFPVKGQGLQYKGLLANEKWEKVFRGGPLFISRLCPVDYHRFHFPDGGKYLDFYTCPGNLHSVNPMALKEKGDIFITNERHISILELDHFGEMAFIEVGAICVGKIKQTHPTNRRFERGDEKGMFLFGGSTVIGIGRPGNWAFNEGPIQNTLNQLETYFKLGQRIATQKAADL